MKEQRNSNKKILHYTKEEDTIIINCVKENPFNLSKAFKKAFSLLEEKRTLNAIASRWYGVLRKQETVFTVSSSKVMGKNIHTQLPNATIATKSLIQRIEDKVIEELVNKLIEKFEI